MKQWEPKLFEKLQKEYSVIIEEIIHHATKKMFYREAMILEALNYPEVEFKKAAYDESTQKEIESKFPFLDEKYRYSVWSKENDPMYFLVLFAQYDDYSIINHQSWKDIIFNIVNFRTFSNEFMKDFDPKDYGTRPGSEVLAKLNPESLEATFFLKKVVGEKIEKRIQAKSLSFGKRLLRLKNVFEKNLAINFSGEEKQLILSPFPLLIGSTKKKSYFLKEDKREANISSAKWGEEIDILFVKDDNIQTIKNWLERHGLTNKIQVHSLSTISSLFSLPLYHASNDVVGEYTTLSSSDYRFINTHIQKLCSLYKKPFPNGSEREHHGLVHGTRTALFSAIITEMYLAQGYSLSTHPKNLTLTGYLHDTGRESDYGEDLWDEQSGQICSEVMTSQLKLSSKDAEVLSKSISEKDKEPAISLEQKIIHDADCIEIRCLLKNPEAFEHERLWMLKDNFPKALLDLFIAEAKMLITLTEKPVIKGFLQNSSDPLRCLMQIVLFSKCFPFIRANASKAIESLCLPSDYLLTPEIEQAINEYLKEKK